ncbi:MAG: hypothetical protein EXS31_17105 [Pedosphaera sp.]|nr:hypothetical protein [Pedosphaera sp.]
MKESAPLQDAASAWKAQQEANRAARLKQLYSPAELWKREQEALAALAKLRPDIARRDRSETKTDRSAGSS